jgi:hypothetical protein
MWLIFLGSGAVIFCLIMFAAWLANKLIISMKRDNRNYELEINKTEEKGEE